MMFLVVRFIWASDHYYLDIMERPQHGCRKEREIPMNLLHQLGVRWSLFTLLLLSSLPSARVAKPSPLHDFYFHPCQYRYLVCQGWVSQLA